MSQLMAESGARNSARNEACFGCLKSESCGARPLPASAETETPRLVSQALKALLPLPAGFIAGFFLIPLFFSGAGDAARAAGGALLMFAAAAGFYLYRRRFPVKPPRCPSFLP
jgi:hypothetical protein